VQFALDKADFITTVAPNMTKKIVREFIKMHTVLDEKTVHTLPFGVDTERFNPYNRIKYKDGVVVISTRRPDNGLDVDTFIKAIPLVLERCNAWFVLAGTGVLLENMKELARKLGVYHRIEFQGHVPHWEIPDLLRTSDIFVSTSPTDGNNISLNEAMACGVFPVVTDIEANRQWIKHQNNGLLYSCKDVKGLAKSIIEAILNPQWRRDIITNNWEIVRTKASWKTSMEDMALHYYRLIKIYEGRKCLSA
jgi:glycosyltransferase involved in cell wall biosynthesis